MAEIEEIEALVPVGWATTDTGPDYTLTNEAIACHGWWNEWLISETQNEYFAKLTDQIADSHKGLESLRAIFPPKPLVFRAFASASPPSVVIIGQDPYHSKGAAVGLSFSVPRDARRPPSLLTIYKELKRDGHLHGVIPKHGDLQQWDDQGVMLLNTALTVRESKPASHLSFGWKTFTKHVIEHINRVCEPGVVFLLWGGFAHKFETVIDTKKHHVLKAGHPSPLNRSNPFLGCGCFTECNKLLIDQGRTKIDWNIN